ncbi:MAG: hypothetical protein ACRDTC_12840, partial [Pseudonocardiaceae bacterium]
MATDDPPQRERSSAPRQQRADNTAHRRPYSSGAPHRMTTDTTAAPSTQQVAINDVGTEEDFLA